MRASIRDTEIYFDVDGAGLVPDGERMRERPVLFAIHGGPGGDHSSYKPALTALTDRAQIVYHDLRGQGRSARGPVGTYTLDQNVEDMDALRHYLGFEQIVPFGGSYGGMVALAYAIRYPQRVSRLIVFATASDFRFIERARQIIAERGTPEQQAAAAPLWEGAFESEEQLQRYYELLGPLYSRTYDADAARKSRSRSIRSPEALNMGFGGFLRTFNLTDQLHRITAPTLVIGARHDWICPPECSEVIARHIPHADLRIFEHSGHSIMADETQAFFDVVRGFLAYPSLQVPR
jgi:proline iminopeptidase